MRPKRLLTTPSHSRFLLMLADGPNRQHVDTYMYKIPVHSSASSSSLPPLAYSLYLFRRCRRHSKRRSHKSALVTVSKSSMDPSHQCHCIRRTGRCCRPLCSRPTVPSHASGRPSIVAPGHGLLRPAGGESGGCAPTSFHEQAR